MQRREMLRLSLTKAARMLPVALAAAGSLGGLTRVGAGLLPPQGVASFPAGAPDETQTPENSTKEEA